MYISVWDSHFYYPDNSPERWQRASLDEPVDYIYAGRQIPENDVYLFTKSSVEIFNKKSHEILSKKLPDQMSPAFSFTAGTGKVNGKVIFYALHHDASLEINGEFGYS